MFYRTRSGTELVPDWLRELDEKDRNAIGQDLMRGNTGGRSAYRCAGRSAKD